MRALYEEGRKKDPEVFKDDIRLRANKVRAVVGYLQDINLSETDLDSKGRAFETFMGSFFRGDFGQYFTPRPIVKFIVEMFGGTISVVSKPGEGVSFVFTIPRDVKAVNQKA